MREQAQISCAVTTTANQCVCFCYIINLLNVICEQQMRGLACASITADERLIVSGLDSTAPTLFKSGILEVKLGSVAEEVDLNISRLELPKTLVHVHYL